METRIYTLCRNEKDDYRRKMNEAAELIRSGELVAFPTETVYGLGGNGLDPEAAKKIYAAKGRPSDNPLILHIGNKYQLRGIVKRIPENAKKMIKTFWPGPLTLIFEKADCVPKETSGGLETVAVRMPSHKDANAFLKACALPVAAPSANLSGRPSPTKAAHVIEDMSGRISCILDAGEADIGVESTILDVSGAKPVLLRPGYITKAQLETVIGPIDEDPAILAHNIIGHTNAVEHPKAPGMKYRHYAPKAPLTIVYGNEQDVLEKIRKNADENTGILTVDEHLSYFQTGKVVSVGKHSDPDTVAHHLFDVLREFDTLGVEKIYSEDFSDNDIGTAIMNRLLKAAGGTYIPADEL